MAQATPETIDAEALRAQVRDAYRAVADDPGGLGERAAVVEERQEQRLSLPLSYE